MEVLHSPFDPIPSLDGLIIDITHHTQLVGSDDATGELIYNREIKLPKQMFTIMPKLHGMNVMFAFHPETGVIPGSRNGFLKDMDAKSARSKGFQQWFKDNQDDINEHFTNDYHDAGLTNDDILYAYAEWAGKGVIPRNTTAIGQVEEKKVYMIEAHYVSNGMTDILPICDTELRNGVSDGLWEEIPKLNILLEIDFSQTASIEDAKRFLSKLINEVVIQSFYKSGIKGPGEGFVLCNTKDRSKKFKVKTASYSNLAEKTKFVRSDDDQKNVNSFVEYSLNELESGLVPRIEQGILTLEGFEKRYVGDLIKWINTDIEGEIECKNKLIELGLDYKKQCIGTISAKVRDYFFKMLEEKK